MKTSSLLASLSVALLGVGSAQAATITFVLQNKTAVTINNTYTNSCGSISPALASVAGNTNSPTHSLNCGTSTAVVFDYNNGTKACRYSMNSIYTPPDPFSGAPASWAPSSTATTKGGGAVCKATLTSIGSNGDYGWTLSIQ